MSPDFIRATRIPKTEGFNLIDFFTKFKSTYANLSNQSNNQNPFFTSDYHSFFNRTSLKRCGAFILLSLILITIIVSSLRKKSNNNDNLKFMDKLNPKLADKLNSMYLHRTLPCSENDPCRFLMVADLDLKSKESDNPLKFKSYLMGAKLVFHSKTNTYSIIFDSRPPLKLIGRHNEAGRGLELSELILFQGKLLSFDDRTGIVFEYLPKKNVLVPRYLITAGDGNTSKGMKIEWATEKNGQLWIGSFGKEYTDPSGTSIISEDNFWIAILDPSGTIEYRNWKPIYEKLRRAVGVPFPGYLLHEAINWSNSLKKWVILPRRVSEQKYDEIEDEKRGATLMILASEDFEQIDLLNVGEIFLERGYSSFKFVPGTNDSVILALKSTEDSIKDTQKTYVSVFETLTGKVLMEDIEVPFAAKFEGIEFLPYDKDFLSSSDYE